MYSESKSPIHEPEDYGRPDERTSRASVEMPAPSYWPMVLAFGIGFILAGVVTHYAVAVVGLVIALRATFGWWGEVIPHEKHEHVAIDPVLRPTPVEAEARTVMRLLAGESQHRTSVPNQVHPYSSGVKGGIVGGTAMALLACLYGLIAQHSIWYPVNLLAGVVMPGMGEASLEQLRSFQSTAFFAALAGHAVISILVGIIYAAILPMFPHRAPLWAGVLMPVFWSGLIATALDIINPALNARISWPWFIACQLGFGLCGGYVIARSDRIDTLRSLSLASRAFLHAPGLRPPGHERENQHPEKQHPEKQQ